MATLSGEAILDYFFNGVALPTFATARSQVVASTPLIATPFNGASVFSAGVLENSNNGSFNWVAEGNISLAGAELGIVTPYSAGTPLTVAWKGSVTFLADDTIAVGDQALHYYLYYTLVRSEAIKWFDQLFGVTAYTRPSNLYLGLVLNAATNLDAGTYTEFSGTYSRQTAAGLWTTPTGNQLSNSVDVVWTGISTPGAGGSYLPALFDASSGGNLLGIFQDRQQAITGGGVPNTKTWPAGDLVARFYDFNDTGGVPAPAGVALGVQNSPFISVGAGITITPAPLLDWIDHCRGIGGRLLVALSVGGVLTVRRHDDAVPDGFSASTSIESSNVSACSIGCRRSGVVDLFYCHSGAVKRRTSRNQGVTFSVSTTIASGYDCVTHWLDEGSGICIAMIRKTSDETWYVAVGTLGTDGTTWTFSTPALVVAGKKGGASVQRRADGMVEFAYVTSGSSAAVIRCKTLLSTGSGTWA